MNATLSPNVLNIENNSLLTFMNYLKHIFLKKLKKILNSEKIDKRLSQILKITLNKFLGKKIITMQFRVVYRPI